LRDLLTVPVHGYLAECLSIFLFLLRDFLVNGGIGTFTYFSVCHITELACLKQGYIRGRAKGQLLFFPVNTVLHIPEF